MDHGMVRVAQCSTGDSMICVADSGVTAIQNILPSGRTFDKPSVFGEVAGEITFVKLTEDNNHVSRKNEEISAYKCYLNSEN